MALHARLATRDDLAALGALMDRAIDQLQSAYLSADQIEASRAIMGIDRQLIDDKTYFLAEQDSRIAGCGGWSRRATLFGGDHSPAQRAPRLLDPATEPARIRAMYTDPAFVRRGVGRLILAQCEQTARSAGFTSAVLMATLAGEPLYRSSGYRSVTKVVQMVDGVGVPLIEMGKPLL